MTTPPTRTRAEAEDLLRLGRARQTAEGALLLPRARYQWNATRACYECCATQPPPDPVTTTQVLRRLGWMLFVSGGVGIIAAMQWFALLWGRIMQAQHCLWRWDPICEMLALGTQLQGATPYTPLVLWGAVGVTVLGFCLLIATQPWQEGWDRNEGALPVEPPVVEPPEPYRLASAETWRTQIGTMLAILGVLGILTVGIILVGNLLR